MTTCASTHVAFALRVCVRACVGVRATAAVFVVRPWHVRDVCTDCPLGVDAYAQLPEAWACTVDVLLPLC